MALHHYTRDLSVRVYRYKLTQTYNIPITTVVYSKSAPTETYMQTPMQMKYLIHKSFHQLCVLFMSHF